MKLPWRQARTTDGPRRTPREPELPPSAAEIARTVAKRGVWWPPSHQPDVWPWSDE